MNQHVKRLCTFLVVVIAGLSSYQVKAGCIDTSIRYQLSDENEIELISNFPGGGFHFGAFYDGSLLDFEQEISDGKYEFGNNEYYSFQNFGFIFTEILRDFSEDTIDALYSGLVDEVKEIAENLNAHIYNVDFAALGFDVQPLIPGCGDITTCTIIIPFQSREFEFVQAFSVNYSDHEGSQVEIITINSGFTTKNDPDMVMMHWSEPFLPPAAICVPEPSSLIVLLISMSMLLFRSFNASS